MASKRFVYTLRVLLVMILTLMALGAGVRTMNAGLSCPDWPLCFGKVIPDFHPGVWFEFVHRAYAGIVALVFFGVFFHVMRNKAMPRAAKAAAIAGFVFLTLQIVMGGLTVVLLVKEIIVTSHLMLATLFFTSVLWIHEAVTKKQGSIVARVPSAVKSVAAFFIVAVLLQIMIGGFVASTYAGSVCVDWPLCNGQWVPTWQGAIGLQVIHRFFAYFLAVAILVFSTALHFKRKANWMTPQLKMLAIMNMVVVFGQVFVGVMNLLYYIPAWLTVIHQSMAILLLATNIRLFFAARAPEAVLVRKGFEPLQANPASQVSV